MGAYLALPITEKCSSDSRDGRLKCGASSMQGWRVSQEDAHNCILNFDGEASLFAVYDGHGGKEVAEYTAEKLPDVIKETDKFKEGNYSDALKEAFIKFDKTLVEPDVVAALKVIADNKTPGTTEDDMEDENIGDLREEAAMPLEQLMARYRKGRLAEKEDSPASPFLRGKATCSTADSSSNAADVSSSSCSPASSSAISSTTGAQPSKSNVSSSGSSSSSDEPCSSSSRSPSKLDWKKHCNGEVSTTRGDVVTNGECGSSEDKSEEVEDGVSSSSVDNGPGSEESTEAKKTKKKKIITDSALFKNFVASGDSDDTSDSDESFAEGAGSSSDDEGVEVDNDEDEEEEDEDDDDDDDDEEECDEDDEFTMKMTDELAERLMEGRLAADKDSFFSCDDAEEEDGIGPKFLMHALKKRTPGADSGCTAVVALVLADRVLVANAGDSRCVACRAGQAVDLSVDHKPEDPLELDRITKAGGKVTSDGRVNGGLNLSRALGDHVYKKVEGLSLEEQMISPLPDIQEIPLTDDLEFLVLACDGIWNFLSSQEVVDFVRQRLQKKPKQLSSICEELFDHCLAPNTLGDGTGCDNMTAVIVQFRPEPEVAAEGDSNKTDVVTTAEVKDTKQGANEEVAENGKVIKVAEEGDATKINDVKEPVGDTAKRRAEDDVDDGSETKRTKTDEGENKTENSNMPSTSL